MIPDNKSIQPSCMNRSTRTHRWINVQKRMRITHTKMHTPNMSFVPQMRSYHIFNILTQICIPPPTSCSPNSPSPIWQSLSQLCSPPHTLSLSVISLAAACSLGRQRCLDKTAIRRSSQSLGLTFQHSQSAKGPPRPPRPIWGPRPMGLEH